jgi:hypothetical protein
MEGTYMIRVREILVLKQNVQFIFQLTPSCAMFEVQNRRVCHHGGWVSEGEQIVVKDYILPIIAYECTNRV